jgi:hypothetical protein
MREIYGFQAAARPPGSPQLDPARHLIAVSLEGAFAPLGRWERIDELRNAYERGANAVEEEVWTAMREKLLRSVEQADIAKRVPLLVVTTTRDALGRVDPDTPLPPPPRAGESLTSLIERLRLGSREQLLDSYGSDPGDWRPFGSQSSVKTILGQLQDEINSQLRDEGLEPFRWDYLDDEFWSQSPEQVLGRLKREPAVVVLDPVSLYDDNVKWMTNDFVMPPIRQNENAVMIVLPPFAMPPTATALRDSIKGLAVEVFNSYWNPPVASRSRFARYVIGVGDLVDLKAGLLAGIGPVLAEGRGEEPVVYTAT